MKDFKLNEFPKISSGFTPTEAYLEQLNQKILNQLPKEPSKPSKGKVIRISKQWIAVAASLVVLFGWVIWNQNQTDWLENVPTEQLVLQKKYTHYYDYAELLNEEDMVKLYQDLEIDENEYWQDNQEYWY
ncbi:MAG: hypothetical protein ACK4JX_10900 [Flavobacterium sp.]